MSFILVGAGLGVAEGAANIIGGIGKSNAAKKLAASNKRPWYNIPTEYQENDNLAAGQAETGLSPSSVNYYTTNANRGLITGVNAITEGGGDVDNLAKLYDQFSQGLSQETAQDQQLKDQHLGTFINANKDFAGQKTQQWALNYYEPYKDTAQLASAEKNAGQSQENAGFSDVLGSVSSYAKSLNYNPDGTMKTMGQKTGSPTLDAPLSIGPSAISTPSFVNTLPTYSTGGGAAVMGSLAKTNAMSPQLQQLYSILNQNNLSVSN